MYSRYTLMFVYDLVGIGLAGSRVMGQGIGNILNTEGNILMTPCRVNGNFVQRWDCELAVERYHELHL